MDDSAEGKKSKKHLGHDPDPFASVPLFSRDGKPLDIKGNKLFPELSKPQRKRSRSRRREKQRESSGLVRNADDVIDLEAILGGLPVDDNLSDGSNALGWTEASNRKSKDGLIEVDSGYITAPKSDTRSPFSDARYSGTKQGNSRRTTTMSAATTLTARSDNWAPRVRDSNKNFGTVGHDYRDLHHERATIGARVHVGELYHRQPRAKFGPDLGLNVQLFEDQLNKSSKVFLEPQVISERTFLTIPFNVLKFVETELGGVPEALWDLVVISGHHNNIWAGSVSEYIGARWPQSSEHIKRVLLALAGSDQDLSAEEEKIDFSNFGRDSEDESSEEEDEDDKEERRQPIDRDLSRTRKESEGGRVVETSQATTAYSATQATWTLKGETTDDLAVSLMLFDNAVAVESVLTMIGDVGLQIQLIEALAWLFAVLHNGKEGPFPCSVGLKTKAANAERTVYVLESTCNPDFASDIPGSCWTSLLPRTACAYNFVPPSWHPDQLQGIELTFDLLCILCGISYETDYDGGIILYGEHALVYPVFLHANCIQWHFQSCEPGDSPHTAIHGERLLGKDLDDLRAISRHFLGLWSNPQVTLGTESVTTYKLAYSRAKELPSTNVKDNVTVGGSISLPRFVSLTGSVTYKVAKTRVTHHLKGPIPDQLHSKITSPVILYCPSEKRAWLVSYVSVVLHLARCRAQMRAELNYHVPACERKADGGRAAWDCIKLYHNVCIKQAEENEVLTEYERNVKIADHVEEVMACVERTRKETNIARGFFRDKIVGYELAAIAKYKDVAIMKKCNLEVLTDGWGSLLEAVGLVFFYEGLEDPIVPAPLSVDANSEGTVCDRALWRSIPQGLNLLTVSLPCLLSLAEQQGEKRDGTIRHLTSKFAWHCPTKGGLYGSCKDQRACTCNYLQRMVPIRSKHTSPRLRFDKPNPGAVVFVYSEDTTMEQAQRNLTTALRSSLSRAVHIRTDSGYSSEIAQSSGRSTLSPTVESFAIASETESDSSSDPPRNTSQNPTRESTETVISQSASVPTSTVPAQSQEAPSVRHPAGVAQRQNNSSVSDASRPNDVRDTRTSTPSIDTVEQPPRHEPRVARRSSATRTEVSLSSTRPSNTRSEGLARWFAVAPRVDKNRRGQRPPDR